jgi:hypothetical protein
MTYSLGIDLGQRVAIVLLDDRLKVRGHKCYEWTIDSFPGYDHPIRWTRRLAADWVRWIWDACLDDECMWLRHYATLADTICAESIWLHAAPHRGRHIQPEGVLIIGEMAAELANLLGTIGKRLTLVDPAELGRVIPKRRRISAMSNGLLGDWGDTDWHTEYGGPRGGSGVRQDVADAAMLAYWGMTRHGARALQV